MAVVKCVHCPRWYWYFRGDHPPKGYCSLKCYEERRTARAAASSKVLPPPPQTVLREIMTHRSQEHACASILVEFPGCDICEELEQAYAGALSWHQAAADAALRKADRAESKKREKAKRKEGKPAKKTARPGRRRKPVQQTLAEALAESSAPKVRARNRARRNPAATPAAADNQPTQESKTA